MGTPTMYNVELETTPFVSSLGTALCSAMCAREYYVWHVIVHNGWRAERGGAWTKRCCRAVQHGHQFMRSRDRVYVGQCSYMDFSGQTVRCRYTCFKSSRVCSCITILLLVRENRRFDILYRRRRTIIGGAGGRGEGIVIEYCNIDWFAKQEIAILLNCVLILYYNERE